MKIFTEFKKNDPFQKGRRNLCLEMISLKIGNEKKIHTKIRMCCCVNKWDLAKTCQYNRKIETKFTKVNECECWELKRERVHRK